MAPLRHARHGVGRSDSLRMVALVAFIALTTTTSITTTAAAAAATTPAHAKGKNNKKAICNSVAGCGFATEEAVVNFVMPIKQTVDALVIERQLTAGIVAATFTIPPSTDPPTAPECEFFQGENRLPVTDWSLASCVQDTTAPPRTMAFTLVCPPGMMMMAQALCRAGVIDSATAEVPNVLAKLPVFDLGTIWGSTGICTISTEGLAPGTVVRMAFAATCTRKFTPLDVPASAAAKGQGGGGLGVDPFAAVLPRGGGN